MKILHFISTPSPVNYGVWSVVIKPFTALKEQFDAESELWFPDIGEDLHEEIQSVPSRAISTDKDAIAALIAGYDPKDSLIISHGNWSLPTKWSRALKKLGFQWIAIPHGMLELWSMRHRWLKKQVYYRLFEKPRLNKTDAIVAVGRPEYENLKRQFGHVVHIPNGIDPFEGSVEKGEDPIRFLFLGRLHKKKGVVPLVRAWMKSKLMGDARYELIIAGPDEGERDKIKHILKAEGLPAASFRHSNIKVSSPVYGPEKAQLLLNSHFFLLPSFSEGFPTAVLEAMTHGCIPLITEGCNFPEAFENEVAIQIVPNPGQITKVLEQVAALSSDQRVALAFNTKAFVDTNYTWNGIAEQQYALYKKVLEKKGM